jgi:hypothetical protein
MSRRQAGLLAALLAWTAVLAAGVFAPVADPPTLSLLDLRARAGEMARGMALAGAMQAALFVPLGALAAALQPDRSRWWDRVLRVFLPACALALTLVFLARWGWWRAPPGALGILVSSAGAMLGLAAGLAWRRGAWARVLFVPGVLGGGAVLAVLALVLVGRSLEPAPAVAERAPLESETRRHLAGLLRGRDPRRIPEGETRTLRLTAAELDQLVAWAAVVGGHARVQTTLGDGAVAGEASVPVPRTGRWLNLRYALTVSVRQGELAVAATALRVGSTDLPASLRDALVSLAVTSLREDRDVRRVLPAVQRLSMTAGEATLTYRRAELPDRMLARLAWGEDVAQRVQEATRAQVDHLLRALAAAPPGDARFVAALEAVFTLARARSSRGSAAEENRAAMVALGVVLGHPRLAMILGAGPTGDRADLAARLRDGTTLRGRADWPRHFAVSAALAAIADVAPSDEAGRLKEELDADGGSGFSFADLLADRAGTTLSAMSTRDDAGAERMQARLVTQVRIDDVFPSAEGLPEGLTDAAFRVQFGGVGGEGYRRLTADIEGRISRCRAFLE